MDKKFRNAEPQVRDMLMRRRKFRAPLPMDPMDLYYSVLGEAQKQAMGMLYSEDSISFQMSTTFTVVLVLPPTFVFSGFDDGEERPDELNKQRINCKVTLPGNMPLMRKSINEYHPVFSRMLEWAQLWQVAHKEVNEGSNTFRVVNEMCRTPAELARVWPRLAKIFFPHVKRPALVRSNTTNIYFVQRRLNADEALLGKMARLEEMLAETLMLPKDEGKELGLVD